MKNRNHTHLTFTTKNHTRHPENILQKPVITQEIKKIQKTIFFHPQKHQKNRFIQPTNSVRHLLQTNNTKKIQKCCKTTQFCIFFKGEKPMNLQQKHKQFAVNPFNLILIVGAKLPRLSNLYFLFIRNGKLLLMVGMCCGINPFCVFSASAAILSIECL